MPEVPRDPGWREVLAIAVAVIGVVVALQLVSAMLPPVHDAFVHFPTAIIVLVAGTVGMLAVATLRRPR